MAKVNRTLIFSPQPSPIPIIDFEKRMGKYLSTHVTEELITQTKQELLADVIFDLDKQGKELVDEDWAYSPLPLFDS
jgi:hypothetical protein